MVGEGRWGWAVVTRVERERERGGGGAGRLLQEYNAGRLLLGNLRLICSERERYCCFINFFARV